MTERTFKWDGRAPLPAMDIEPGETILIELTPEAAELLRAHGGRIDWTNDDGTRGSTPIKPPGLLWPLPFALVIFVFMVNLGLLFYALEDPPARRALFIFSIALCVALPHVPTNRNR